MTKLSKRIRVGLLALCVIASQTLSAVFLPMIAYASEGENTIVYDEDSSDDIDYNNDGDFGYEDIDNDFNDNDIDFGFDYDKDTVIEDGKDDEDGFEEVTSETTASSLEAEQEAYIKLGFIGWYPVVNGDSSPRVNQTSFYWQELKEGEMIDWDAVDAAYDIWISDGGYPRATDGWHSSGANRIEFAENQRHTIGYSDFGDDTLETLYQAYYLDSGYVANHSGGSIEPEDPSIMGGSGDEKIKGFISFEKFVNTGEAIVAWRDWEGNADRDEITFDVYDADGNFVAGGFTIDESGIVVAEHENIIPGQTYIIKENLGVLEDKYAGGKETQVTADGRETTYYVIISSPADSGAYEVDPANSWRMPSDTRHIKQLWNQGISGDAFNDMMNITDSSGNTPAWIWDRPDSWEHGVTGSQVIVYTKSFFIEDVSKIVPRDTSWSVPLYFASDNAAVVYVNGKYAGHTTWAMEGRNHDFSGDSFVFDDLTYDSFDGARWDRLYFIEIAHLLQDGDNEIVFYAANSQFVDDGTPNVQYNIENNPAGLIFGTQFKTVSEGAPGVMGMFVNDLKGNVGGNEDDENTTTHPGGDEDDGEDNDSLTPNPEDNNITAPGDSGGGSGSDDSSNSGSGTNIGGGNIYDWDNGSAGNSTRRSAGRPIPVSPGGFVVIGDDLVPLASAMSSGDLVTIIDDEVPLGSLPRTGSVANPMGGLSGLIAALSLGFIGMRKKDK